MLFLIHLRIIACIEVAYDPQDFGALESAAKIAGIN